jgi:hypothetical protein
MTGGVENAVHLHVDIPHTGARYYDLLFEDVRKELCEFPYEYFLLVLPFGGYCCKLVLQTTPEEKITRIKIWRTCCPNYHC